MRNTLIAASAVVLLASTSAFAFPLGNTGIEVHSTVEGQYNTSTTTTTTTFTPELRYNVMPNVDLTLGTVVDLQAATWTGAYVGARADFTYNLGEKVDMNHLVVANYNTMTGVVAATYTPTVSYAVSGALSAYADTDVNLRNIAWAGANVGAKYTVTNNVAVYGEINTSTTDVSLGVKINF